MVNLLAGFCHLMHCSTIVEPRGGSDDSNERPDIQMDLMQCTLLADVTIAHPTCKSYRNLVAQKRSPDCVGDASAARKNKKYAEDARLHNKTFSPFVLYTYGGFHATALTVIQSMIKSLEPTRCLLSTAAWRQKLMQSIAIAVQRGNGRHHGVCATARSRGDARPSCSTHPLGARTGSALR